MCSWCVRGPDLTRLKQVPPNPALTKGRKYLVGYVGVMGKQEGIDLLLQAVQLIVQAPAAAPTSSSGWWAAAPSCRPCASSPGIWASPST